MAKKDKKEVTIIPDGMKCFQKSVGGTIRFPNRIIKSGQKFWIIPAAIPKAFLDAVKEVAPDYTAIIVQVDNIPVAFDEDENTNVEEKFKMVTVVGKDGKVLKKGNSPLYNIIDEDSKPINDKPLRKGKAEELLEGLLS